MPKNLPKEEEIHLYKLSLIPFIIVLNFIAVLLAISMTNYPIESFLGLIIRAGIPLSIFPITSLFLAFEVFYHLKVKSPLKFHVKRFAGRMIFLLICLSSFFVVLIALYITLFALVGNYVFLYGPAVWGGISYPFFKKFRHVINRLTEGSF